MADACPVCGAIDGSCFVLPLTKPLVGELGEPYPEPDAEVAEGQVHDYVIATGTEPDP